MQSRSEDLELPFLGEQATRVPSRLSTNGKSISPDSLTSLSTDSWLVGNQTETRSRDSMSLAECWSFDNSCWSEADFPAVFFFFHISRFDTFHEIQVTNTNTKSVEKENLKAIIADSCVVKKDKTDQGETQSWDSMSLLRLTTKKKIYEI